MGKGTPTTGTRPITIDILTIKYKRSYPVITEISEFEKFRKEKEEENLKKNKKLGFQS